MFGQQPQQQPAQRLTWEEYLDRIKNGPAPTYTPPANAQQAQGPGTAAGWDTASAGNRGGVFGNITGGKNSGGGTVINRIPATPVDYDRMHSILNSGVLEGGHAQTSADIPKQAAPAAPQPAPAQQPQQTPFQAFMTSLMSGGK